jgi:hypothetical protein
MGYICPYCGEGLPEDEICPCQSFGDDEDDQPETRTIIRGSLLPVIRGERVGVVAGERGGG